MMKCLFLVLCLLSVVFAVDWRNITTPAQMRAVPPSEFVNFTEEDAAGLDYQRSRACHGFIAPQIAKIPSESFRGFTGICVSDWGVSCCAAMSKNDIENMNDGLGGISPKCMANLNPEACRGIDLGRLEDETFGGITAKCVANTTPHEWSDVRRMQTQYLNSEACSGLSRDALSQMTTPYALHGFAQQCIESLKPESCSGVSKLANFGQNIKYMKPDCFNNILKQWGSCSGISHNFVWNFSNELIGAMSSDCLNSWNWDAYSALSWNQCNSINHDSYWHARDDVRNSIKNTCHLGWM